MPLKLFSGRTSFYYEYEGSKLEYTIVDNESCWVTGYKKFADDFSGDLIIPEVAFLGKTGYTVTQIEESALRIVDEFTSVVVPNTVTKIGQWAFYGNGSLIKAEIGESVKEIGRDVFGGCPLKTLIFNARNCESVGTREKPLFPSSLESLKIGDRVTIIPDFAFPYCYKLTMVDIPNSVNRIGNNAFEHCGGMSVNLSNSLITIGSNAFCACNLKSIDLPNSLKIIEERAFLGNDLTSIEIPNSVISIGNEAFGNCEKLTTVIFNAENCNNCGNIYYPAFPSTVDTLVIGDKVSKIPNYAFRYTNLNFIDLPNSVTEIGERAFQGCEFKSVVIPAFVKSIGVEAFDVYSGLTDLAFNATECLSCGSSTASAFSSSITNLSIGDNVTVIPAYAFKNIQGLTSVDIPNSVNAIGDEAFSNCNYLKSVFLPNSVTELGKGVFSSCWRLTNLEIPNSLKKIDVLTFYDCSSLPSIEIPETVTEIGVMAFCGCKSISSITIPNSVRSIGYQAFAACQNLTTVIFNAENCEACGLPNFPAFPNFDTLIIGDKVSIIPEFAFSECRGFKSVVIPNSVTYIGNGAFKDTSLNTLTFNAEHCEYCGSISEPAFPETLTVLMLGDKVARIPDFTFNECRNLTSVVIPSTVTSIGEAAFAECHKLESVMIGSRVASIGRQAFMNCPVTSIVIPSHVTEIGEQAFFGCSLDTIVMGCGLKSIGRSAFHNMTPISNIYITAQTPPEISDETFNDYSAKLWLQGEAAQNSYEKSSYWNLFDKTTMEAPTGINNWGFKKINGKPGEKYGVNATLLPENVTFPYIFWYSTNSDVATVSFDWAFDPTVTLNSDIEFGSCIIIGESLYADGPIVEVPVTVNSGNIAVTGITLSDSKLELVLGQTATLTAKVEPDGAVDKIITWSSSNEEVATVDFNGNVVAMGIGESVIIASCDNVSAVCNVTVLPILVESIILSDVDLSLIEGQKVNLTATVFPEDATNKSIIWSSSDISVATVSSDGVVMAVGVGDVLVTATAADDSGISASTVITCNEAKDYTVTYDFSEPLNLIPAQNVSSDNEPVCEVNDVVFTNNNISLVASGGNTSPRLWHNYSSNSAELRVYNGGQITISTQNESSVITGIEIYGNQLDALVFNGEAFNDNTKISFILEELSDSISLDCRTKGSHKRADISTITVICRGSSDVGYDKILVESLTIDPTEWNGVEGSEFTITTTVLPEDAYDKALIFKSSDESVATVNAKGNVKVLKEGTSVITVSTVDGSNIKAECVITGLSGVDIIFTDSNALVEVYDMNGILLKKCFIREDLKQLKPGVYILRNGYTVMKAVVK